MAKVKANKAANKVAVTRTQGSKSTMVDQVSSHAKERAVKKESKGEKESKEEHKDTEEEDDEDSNSASSNSDDDDE